MSAPVAFAVAAFVVCQSGLLAFAVHRAVLLWRLRRTGERPEAPAAPPAPRPAVTLQLPLYNEPEVAARLIAAVGGMDWPRDRFEVQVLDDSTDSTRAIVDAAVARLHARGIEASVLRRPDRSGYKAGALAAGLARARGEWIAIFDADFVPGRDFLVRLAPHFADPRVGMVQARWAHLNRDHSRRTAAQALMLDAHFMIEQAVRTHAGLFISFNGTAGIWRRRCIEDAGGWSAATLTEDLDLSYRAQLRGWRLVYDGRVEAPAELPEAIDAIQGQQRRWARGSMQTARRILPALWRAPLPLRVRLEATAHLLGHAAYALLLAQAVLAGPLLFALPPAPRAWTLWIGAATVAVGLVPVVAFLVVPQRAQGRPARRIARDVLAALVLHAGLALANGWAAARGLTSDSGEFERTPKTGAGLAPAAAPPAAGRSRAARAPWGEALCAGYFLVLLTAALATGQLRAAPFLLLLGAGFLEVGWLARVPARPRESQPVSD